MECAQDAIEGGDEEGGSGGRVDCGLFRLTRKEIVQKFGKSFRKLTVPDYVLRLGLQASNAKEYFDDLFRSKGILETRFHREARFWSSLLDDMVLVDKFDMFTSKSMVHVVDKLQEIEVALGPVTSAANLDRAVFLAEVFSFPVDDELLSSLKKVHKEAQKRIARRQRLRRLERKYGGLKFVYSKQVARMEADLLREYG